MSKIKIMQKIKSSIVIVLALLSMSVPLAMVPALTTYADPPNSTGTGPADSANKNTTDNKDANPTCEVDSQGKLKNPLDPAKPCLLNGKICNDPSKVYTDTDCKTSDPAVANTCTNGDCSGLFDAYINPAVKVLSGLMGVIVVISIVVGGIQYSSAGGDPGKVSAARKRIMNSVIALLAYLFMLAFLQFLLPGGLL